MQCKYCEKEFEKTSRAQKYCTGYCARKAQKRRLTERYERERDRRKVEYHYPYADGYKHYKLKKKKVATTSTRLLNLIDQLDTTEVGLAIGCGVPLRTISNVILGYKGNLSTESLIKIAQYTGCTTDYLLGF